MRAAAVCIAFVLTCTGGSFVAGIRYMDPMSPQPGNNGDIGDKRMDLTEPSCEELRAMWRYTKRQSRAAKATNGYPIYQDQVYNMWQMYPNGPKSSVPTYRGEYPAPPLRQPRRIRVARSRELEKFEEARADFRVGVISGR